MKGSGCRPWRGAAFDCCRTPSHDRTKDLGATRRPAAGGSRERLHAWITRAVFYRSDQTSTLLVVAASGDVRGSRLPTHAESGKTNVPIERVQLRTVKSGSPPGAGWVSSPSICHLSSVIPHFLCRGSNASRNPSPRKFNASNVLPIAIAGKTSNHQ